MPIETEVLTGDHAGESGYRIDRARYELPISTSNPTRCGRCRCPPCALRPTAITAGEALWKLGGAQVDVGPAVTASVPELPAAGAARRRRARPFDFTYRGSARRSIPTGCCCATASGTSSAATTSTTSCAPTESTASRARCRSSARWGVRAPRGFDPRDGFPTDPKQFGDGGDDDGRAGCASTPSGPPLVERELGSDRVVARRRNGAIEVGCRAPTPAFRSWVLGLLRPRRGAVARRRARRRSSPAGCTRCRSAVEDGR